MSDDPAVHFDDAGPSCEANETVRFGLIAVPTCEPSQETSQSRAGDPFATFAQGTINFLRREFGAGAGRGSR